MINKFSKTVTQDETQPGAQAMLYGIGLGESDAGGWRAPVLLASARDNEGIAAIIEAVEAHRRHLETRSDLASRRREAELDFVRDALARRYGRYGIERWGGDEALDARLAADTQTTSPSAWVRTLSLEIEDALRKA